MILRFYQGDTPVHQIDDDEGLVLPSPGEYVRLDPSESAWYVEAIVLVYSFDRVSDRADIAVTRAHPAPFPQITRVPKEMGLIPPLEPPKEPKSAKT